MAMQRAMGKKPVLFSLICCLVHGESTARRLPKFSPDPGYRLHIALWAIQLGWISLFQIQEKSSISPHVVFLHELNGHGVGITLLQLSSWLFLAVDDN